MELFLDRKMEPSELLEKLSKYTPRKIELQLNRNRSCYLSVLKKQRLELKLSLHESFLYAEEKIIEAVVRYSVRREAASLRELKKFITYFFDRHDYSERVDAEMVTTQGAHFNLKEIYEQVKKEYFEESFDAQISWFARPDYQSYTHITYGSYSRPLRLIRINKLLDGSFVPLYFISFIVYHEMLHHVCRPQIDERGRVVVHTKEFKAREKLFSHYQEARSWEKKSHQLFKRNRK